MTPAPELNVPASTATVNVSIINSGSIRGTNAQFLIEPHISGHDWLAAPYHWNLPPPLTERFKQSGAQLIVPKGVREILDEGGVDTKAIEAVVWSHWHFDHTGDPSTFEPSTALIVGPGSKERVFPGYPQDPNAHFSEADVAGREVRELDFTKTGLKIGRFDALDYFGDGSFYFLDSPGHAVGHMCGLARVTSGPDSFILMAGDAIHHSGELRPHPWHPLPEAVLPHPFTMSSSSACPGELFEGVLRDGKYSPFYLPAKPASGRQIHYDVPVMIQTIQKLQEADAHDNILFVVAHDDTLLDIVDYFPKTANDFVERPRIISPPLLDIFTTPLVTACPIE
ncbi:uncharacterized protein K452DRAFT_321594 [Aplosporella prunicola CBS 121167]|uniref:Metallo-beta-lactamase domain-containing protein n=1 Tax=Aplosporella prunicola CBS 121167 TaxID=1176127 RepID=A0A6A6B2B5_9PEZI|nr:uncharacterized protein K452DRAFT_321594 [Aplosporella prunicola CBS 121167]KAF2137738.1 hypothetical protein K452DRAFT_321594 [Aplosporella prunicola CBS 121167]